MIIAVGIRHTTARAALGSVAAGNRLGLLALANMDTVPLPVCPECGGTKNKLVATHSIKELSDSTKIEATIYAFTCQHCRMSFTVEVKAGDVPRKPAA